MEYEGKQRGGGGGGRGVRSNKIRGYVGLNEMRISVVSFFLSFFFLSFSLSLSLFLRLRTVLTSEHVVTILIPPSFLVERKKWETMDR